MSNYNLKFKHLSSKDRSFIESALNNADSFKAIALALAKDPTTIAKEVKRNCITKYPLEFGELKNVCSNRQSCKKFYVCSAKSSCNKSCSSCKICHTLCSNFHYQNCERLAKPPYVCNPCCKKTSCREIKKLYSAFDANNSYIKLLSNARSGISISKEKFNEIDNLISTLVIENNLSINHIIANNSDVIPLSSRTIYRYFDNNILTASNLDLPRKLSFKPRKTDNSKHDVDYTYLEGRRYLDFENYIKLNPEQEVIEIDCVEGRKGSSVLLTILFRNSSLILIFKLENKSANLVNKTIKNLIITVGKTRFKKYFPLILSDRGSEFKRLSEIEFDSAGNRLTRVFYCNPNCSFQKGMLEKNHTLIRMVYPKGNSFDSLTNYDVISLMNNINNYSRKIFDGKTSLDVFKETKPINFVEALKQKKIAPNKVCLRAKMPKHKK